MLDIEKKGRRNINRLSIIYGTNSGRSPQNWILHDLFLKNGP